LDHKDEYYYYLVVVTAVTEDEDYSVSSKGTACLLSGPFFLECRNSVATPPLNLELHEESQFPLSATPFYLSDLYLGLGS